MLKYIKLGTKAKEFFNYDGNPLPIRPLSTYELDQAFVMAVEGISPLIFDAVISSKLDVYESQEIIITKDNYKAFLEYYSEIDYWVVYFAMKDFQDEEFSMPDYSGEFKDDFVDWDVEKPKGYYMVRNMKYIHKIARDIKNMTEQPVESLMEILKNKEGQLLATMVHAFHVPLASEAWQLTPLQTDFIYYTRPGAPVIVDDIKDVPGIKGGTLEDITNQLREFGFDA